MWVKSYSRVVSGVTKEDVWRAWADVNNWPKWDEGLEFCQMNGEFEKNNQFILKPAGGPKVKIILSEVTPNKTFTDYCKFLGATMYDVHDLEEISEGLRITNTIKVTGPLRFIWVKLVASNIVKTLPKQMNAFVEYVRKLNA